MSALELFNSGAEDISSDQVTKAVELVMVLLGNASYHISTLRMAKVLKEKNLVTWAQDHEVKFLKADPQLLGPEFPKHATGAGVSSPELGDITISYQWYILT